MKDSEKIANIREEYSAELGDMNEVKQYEIPFMSKDKLKKTKQKKKDKPEL